MALPLHIYKLSQHCSALGIDEMVVCPGSRSAALTLAFARNPDIKTQVIADERSAGFVALGNASVHKKTVGLVCTSGSAVYNFAPAVVEAYFQEVPLIIFTADRPPEWIHQYDGQTIYQDNIFGKHVKKFFQLPHDYDKIDAIAQTNLIIKEAYELSQAEPKGPVHINVPISEPFYPANSEIFDYNLDKPEIKDTVISKPQISESKWNELVAIFNAAERPLLAIGQQDDDVNEFLQNLSHKTLILADSISNVGIKDIIRHHDLFIQNVENNLMPDLLITTNKSFISKAFKQKIRKNPPKFHWHVQDNPAIIDTFKCLSHKIEMDVADFLDQLSQKTESKNLEYAQAWRALEENAINKAKAFLNDVAFGELSATQMILNSLTENMSLHIGNSMPVRYLNYLQFAKNNKTKIYANRGTSGIDGTVSTAIGQAQALDNTHFCLVGDTAFFYDSNALFVENLPKNLKIIIINNAGGNIFRNIDGPNKQAELNDFFVLKQTRKAESLAREAGVYYTQAHDHAGMEEALKTFISEGTQVLEVFTDGEHDAEIFQKFKTYII